jgi:hypothetical protein
MSGHFSIALDPFSRRSARGALRIAAIGLGIFAATAPAMSAGPFDFLFKPPSAPAPSVEAYAAPLSLTDSLFQLQAPKIAVRARPIARAPAHPAAPTAQAAARRSDETCCMPADDASAVLLNDRTLRPGDAVVTRDGIRIFEGPVSAHHRLAEFAPLGQARDVASGARSLLAALDAPAGKMLPAQASVQPEPKAVAERPKAASHFVLADR